MRSRHLLLVLSAGSSLACAGILHRDRDKDGFRADEDCDDENPDAHPGAVEVCDDADVDEDCNGAADDQDPDPGGLLLWYADLDGDGWGDRNGESHESCDPPEGFGPTGDCDDGNAATHPEADEECDQEDQDCDGQVDEEPVDGIYTWTDEDGDGYGSGEPVIVCEAGSGTAGADGDCDDADRDVNPEADERCNGVDDDCDGAVDDEDSDVGSGETATWYRDGDGDGWGDSSETTESCAQPAGYVAEDTDCDDSDSDVHPSAEEVCGDGVDQDCNGTAAGCGWEDEVEEGRAGAVFSGAADGSFGSAVARLPDTDGDGAEEVVVGDWLEGGLGAVYCWTGAPSGALTSPAADGSLTGNDPGEGLGMSLSAGDLDGDGWGDLVVGSSQSDLGSGSNTGAAWVFEGPLTRGLDTADAVGVRYSAGVSLGSFALAADLDADGDEELLVPGYEGAAYILHGPITGTSTVTTDDDVTLGDEGSGSMGGWVCPAGDVNGDGQDDVLVGASTGTSGESGAGALYLALGPLVSGALGPAEMEGQRYGESSGALAGRCHPGGDLDGDGYADSLAGSSDGGGGPTHIVTGPWSGTASFATADAEIDDEGTYVGHVLDVRGDADGDGRSDLVLDGGGRGEVYLFYGGSVRGNLTVADADARFAAPAGGIDFGVSLAWVDADGDGFSDLLAGDAQFGDPGGRAFLYYAGGM